MYRCFTNSHFIFQGEPSFKCSIVLLSDHLGKIIVYILCSQLCITIILHQNYDLKQFVFLAGDKVSILVVQQLGLVRYFPLAYMYNFQIYY